jgi:hypothetical protein
MDAVQVYSQLSRNVSAEIQNISMLYKQIIQHPAISSASPEDIKKKILEMYFNLLDQKALIGSSIPVVSFYELIDKVYSHNEEVIYEIALQTVISEWQDNLRQIDECAMEEEVEQEAISIEDSLSYSASYYPFGKYLVDILAFHKLPLLATSGDDVFASFADENNSMIEDLIINDCQQPLIINFGKGEVFSPKGVLAIGGVKIE